MKSTSGTSSLDDLNPPRSDRPRLSSTSSSRSTSEFERVPSSWTWSSSAYAGPSTDARSISRRRINRWLIDNGHHHGQRGPSSSPSSFLVDNGNSDDHVRYGCSTRILTVRDVIPQSRLAIYGDFQYHPQDVTYKAAILTLISDEDPILGNGADSTNRGPEDPIMKIPFVEKTISRVFKGLEKASADAGRPTPESNDQKSIREYVYRQQQLASRKFKLKKLLRLIKSFDIWTLWNMSKMKEVTDDEHRLMWTTYGPAFSHLPTRPITTKWGPAFIDDYSHLPTITTTSDSKLKDITATASSESKDRRSKEISSLPVANEEMQLEINLLAMTKYVERLFQPEVRHWSSSSLGRRPKLESLFQRRTTATSGLKFGGSPSTEQQPLGTEEICTSSSNNNVRTCGRRASSISANSSVDSRKWAKWSTDIRQTNSEPNIGTLSSNCKYKNGETTGLMALTPPPSHAINLPTTTNDYERKSWAAIVATTNTRTDNRHSLQMDTLASGYSALPDCTYQDATSQGSQFWNKNNSVIPGLPAHSTTTTTTVHQTQQVAGATPASTVADHQHHQFRQVQSLKTFKTTDSCFAPSPSWPTIQWHQMVCQPQEWQDRTRSSTPADCTEPPLISLQHHFHKQQKQQQQQFWPINVMLSSLTPCHTNNNGHLGHHQLMNQQQQNVHQAVPAVTYQVAPMNTASGIGMNASGIQAAATGIAGHVSAKSSSSLQPAWQPLRMTMPMSHRTDQSLSRLPSDDPIKAATDKFLHVEAGSSSSSNVLATSSSRAHHVLNLTPQVTPQIWDWVTTVPKKRKQRPRREPRHLVTLTTGGGHLSSTSLSPALEGDEMKFCLSTLRRVGSTTTTEALLRSSCEPTMRLPHGHRRWASVDTLLCFNSARRSQEDQDGNAVVLESTSTSSSSSSAAEEKTPPDFMRMTSAPCTMAAFTRHGAGPSIDLQQVSAIGVLGRDDVTFVKAHEDKDTVQDDYK